MTLGNNIGIKDKLIKKTTIKKNITINGSKTSNGSKGSKANNASKAVFLPTHDKTKATTQTKKATFYVKTELLEKLYNFAYWERYNITEAINITLADGLTEKTTKSKDTI